MRNGSNKDLLFIPLRGYPQDLGKLKKNNISGVAEHSSIIPENKRISVMDKNKGYLVVYGGANYFAPIVETGISKKLEIARDLYEIQKMKEPEKVLK
ncbi:NrpR regulatory domain-containing protein [Thermococcus sp.]|uniref:NrpR regulatory domain-containing protein n=1 Tax=Thermococcus sp. TaxID=35749 RepID=UPI0034584ED4